MPHVTERAPLSDGWVTFDCYGTLVDWNAGIRRVLGRVFGGAGADDALRRYHEIEPVLQADGRRSYREVLTEALRSLGATGDQTTALAESLPSWPPFPEVRGALEAVRAGGWKLAILSNTDRDYLDASIRRIGVPIDATIVASEIGAYKPAHRHWEEFFRQTGADRRRHVHVAASLFHDIAPAAELGLRAIWINRLDETSPLPRLRELRDLSRLAATLADL
jgi:2-haloacid dehalogenase